MSYGELWAALSELHYLPGWTFELRAGPTMNAASLGLSGDAFPAVTSARGAMLIPEYTPVYLLVILDTADSMTGEPVRISHSFAVPHHSYTGRPWLQWLIECIFRVHMHEAMEHFRVGEDWRPFYPEHGPNASPYLVKLKPKEQAL